LLPSFEIFKEFEEWRNDKLVFKEGVEWEIKHPYIKLDQKIKVKLDWCFLLDNKTPHGLAQITYYDDKYGSNSFNGVAVFNNGVLDGGGPAVFINFDNAVF
jgi:hypothetical protein